MQIVKIRARIGPLNKTVPISAGYRPTLMIGGQKALSNFEAVEPEALPPEEIGEAEVVVGWDWPVPCSFVTGASFSILEGGQEVGQGSVIQVISSETR